MEIVAYRVWVNKKTGAKASIHGALPYRGATEKPDWEIQEKGFTVYNPKSGTYGIGRPPFKTRAEADEWLAAYNKRRKNPVPLAKGTKRNPDSAEVAKAYRAWRAAAEKGYGNRDNSAAHMVKVDARIRRLKAKYEALAELARNANPVPLAKGTARKRRKNPASDNFLFVVIHDNNVSWRTQSGLSGSDPYSKLSEVETIIFNLKKRFGLTNKQVEIRNERARKSNPRPRLGTKNPKRKSSATGRAPTKRLVTRRTRNMKKGYFPNPAQRATPKWLEARVRRLSNALGMPLSFSRQNPGDGARYQVLDASGSHRISGTLKAGDMDMWLDGAIEVLQLLELKKRGSL